MIVRVDYVFKLMLRSPRKKKLKLNVKENNFIKGLKYNFLSYFLYKNKFNVNK